MRMFKVVPILGLAMLLALPGVAPAIHVAVWLDGSTTDGGNAIPSRINTAFGAGSATLVTTAQLNTPGFLNSFDAVIVSRNGASFGTSLSAASATNIKNYVGSGMNQGGVALFNWDAADNLLGSHSGDPYDPNIDKLFVNAVMFAASTGHGYIGEFNGAVQGVTSNANGFQALNLLPGRAGTLGGYGPQFVFHLGPIGAGNAINAGIPYPFTDDDNSTFRSIVAGADPNNEVSLFNENDNNHPAILANQAVIQGGTTPEPGTLTIAAVSVLGLMGYRWRRQQKTA